jgi:Putative transmembrane family 234
MNVPDLISLLLVGAFWGCTNPFLRKGSLEAAAAQPKAEEARSTQHDHNQEPISRKDEMKKVTIVQKILSTLARFRNIRVWLPYLLNQFGSVLFYWTLAKSELSLAVPICNALALLFSILTTFWLGHERVDQPLRMACGAALVMGGVGLCLLSRQ